MAKTAKSAKSGGPDPEAIPFEDAMEKLEAIVEEMETEDLPLEKLLARYEEGTRLVAACQKKLAQAELKIQQLEKNAGGELELNEARIETSEE